MSFESEISLAALSAFTVSASFNGADVEVIVDRSVEVMDEDGNVRQVAVLVHAYKADFPEWEPGDRLITDDGHFKLFQKLYDDGYIVRIEASPVAIVAGV